MEYQIKLKTGFPTSRVKAYECSTDGFNVEWLYFIPLVCTYKIVTRGVSSVWQNAWFAFKRSRVRVPHAPQTVELWKCHSYTGRSQNKNGILEGWQSGWLRWSWKPLTFMGPGVQIPPPPPKNHVGKPTIPKATWPCGTWSPQFCDTGRLHWAFCPMGERTFRNSLV